MTDKKQALVLFSGGQDSSTCLAWALDRYDHVETIGFDYGQRHAIELQCRGLLRDGMKRINPHWSYKLGQKRSAHTPVDLIRHVPLKWTSEVTGR